ncbi:MAG: hypothetical protein RL038_687 [Actinomycetota bacterium]
MTLGSTDIVFKNVGYEYSTAAGRVKALEDVNLRFPQATSTAVIGRSGSGKSTLVTLLAAMRKPTSGTIHYWGQAIDLLSDNELSALRSKSIGLVFQSFNLELNFTAVDNVLVPWYFRSDFRRKEAIAKAEYALELVGIPELRNRKVGQMSGGQRQRVAIARAILFNPRLLVADEPTGNLDEETGFEVTQILLGLPRDLGTTVVMVTHDPQLASLAERKIQISQGRLVGDDISP